MDLETVCQLREEEVYPALFGQVRRGIFPLTKELFDIAFGHNKLDPRWLLYGVFEFAPIADRSSWLYVTSGHSNPWEQDPSDFARSEESGSGVEFTLETSEQGDWAIRALQQMLALDLLMAAGRFGAPNRLGLYSRLPLKAPLNGQPNCHIRNLMIVEREHGPQEFSLPSGRVILAGFTGITDAELVFAKANGSPALVEMLRAAGYLAVVDPSRQPLPV